MSCSRNRSNRMGKPARFVLALVASGVLVLAGGALAQDEVTTADDDSGSLPAEEIVDDGSGRARPAIEGGSTDEVIDDGPPISYDAEGRRDPFRPLIGQTDQAPGECDDKLECLLLQDLRLTSILKTRDGNIATFEGGPRKQGYFAKEGDRLRNGIVHQIDYERLVVTVREELTDDRLLKPWRDWNMELFRQDEPRAGAKKKR